MRFIRRILIFFVFLLAVLLVGVSLIPVFFKEKIAETTKAAINDRINGVVDFEDVSVSVFKHFPNLTIGLKSFTLDGVDQFEGVRLAEVASFDLAVNLWSAISSTLPLTLNSIYLEEPNLRIVVLKDGSANYDIAIPAEAGTVESTSETADFELNLAKYAISNGHFVYDDQVGGTFAEVYGLDHEGSGDLTLNVYDLNTNTEIEALTVRYGGVTYLDEAQTNLDAIFHIDQSTATYSLKENSLQVNQLQLDLEGFVKLLSNDEIEMDFNFRSPQNQFKDLFSLIPNAFIEGYESVNIDGRFELKGMVKGVYDGAKETYPAFDVMMLVNDGNVQYPGLPLGIGAINADLAVKSPTSNLDNMSIVARKFGLNLGGEPINGRFSLTTPISDPNLDGAIKGKLDLGKFMQAYPVEGIEQLAGIIDADLTAKARMSSIDLGKYDEVDMDGFISASNLIYADQVYPKIQIPEAKIGLMPSALTIESFEGQFGKSDVSATGKIENVLAYFSPEKTMRGDVKLTSTLFDANEWVVEEPENDVESITEDAPTPLSQPADYKVFDQFDFKIDATLGKLVYDTYELTDNYVNGRITSNELDISQLSGNIQGSDFRATGKITQIFDYLFKGGVLGGDINLMASKIDLNPFMVTTETTAESVNGTEEPLTIEAILVPENMAMSMNANIGMLIYDKITLKNLTGKLDLDDRAVFLENITGNGLGGSLAMSGEYNTRERTKPAFNIKYDLSNLDFQQSFNALNTFQKLAPIGKFINGQFSTSLIMDGVIGSDLYPIMEAINAKGYLETVNGVIKGFKPLELVGNALDIQEIKQGLPIAKTRNWFEVENGTVIIEPFDFNVDGIDMNIAGSHSISQNIDYTIVAKVPRAKLEGSSVGQLANQGISFVQNQLGKLGVKGQNAEFFNIQLNITGTLTQPKIGTKLLGVDGETSVVESAKETAKEVVKEKTTQAVDSAKVVAKQALEKAADTLKQEVTKKVEDALGKVIDSTFVGKLDSNQQEKVKDIKDALDQFNPFKKKKKKNN